VLYEGVEEPYVDLQHGRIEAVLLDDIIASRYGIPKDGLRVVGDLRDGYYAIGVRPSEPDVAEALDGALANITASGELQRILEKYGLWNERQARLRHWTEADQAGMLGLPSKPPSFGARHVVLFLKGAAVTLLVSVLAMAIAIPLGLALSLARLFGGT